jgi:hypothetical protein
MDLLPSGIESLEKSGLDVTHLGTELFESVTFHKERHFDDAVIAPKTNAAFRCIETAAWIRKAQCHRFSPRARTGAASPSGLILTIKDRFIISPKAHASAIFESIFSSYHGRPSVRQRTQPGTMSIQLYGVDDHDQGPPRPVSVSSINMMSYFPRKRLGYA